MPKLTKDIPKTHVDILDSKGFAHVATVRPDGKLSNNPVGLIWDGERVRFSTLRSRKKVRNLMADPRIALSMYDSENPWRYLEIRGTATLEDDVDRSFINQIAQKYMGQPEYPFDLPGDERVTVTVEVEQVSAEHVRAGDHGGEMPEEWKR